MPPRIRISALAAGIAAAAALGLSPTPSALADTRSVPPAESAPTTVEVCGQGADETHPGSMILTCADNGETAEQLTWTSWTPTSATATGRVAWRSCSADCAHATTWKSAAASFTLGRSQYVPGHGNIFTALTLHATGPTPAGFMRDLMFDETPVSVMQDRAAAGSPARSGRAARFDRANGFGRDNGFARFTRFTRNARIGTAHVDFDTAPSGTLGYAEIEGFWIAAGGSADTAETAAAIAGAESGFEPGIIQQDVDYCGSGGDKAGWGLWQITCGDSEPSFGTDFQLLDPWNNAEAAIAKYDGDGADDVNGFGLWSTYTSGAYEDFMQDVAPASDVADPGQYVQDGSTPSGTPSSSAADPGGVYGPSMGGGDQGE